MVYRLLKSFRNTATYQNLWGGGGGTIHPRVKDVTFLQAKNMPNEIAIGSNSVTSNFKSNRNLGPRRVKQIP